MRNQNYLILYYVCWWCSSESSSQTESYEWGEMGSACAFLTGFHDGTANSGFTERSKVKHKLTCLYSLVSSTDTESRTLQNPSIPCIFLSVLNGKGDAVSSFWFLCHIVLRVKRKTYFRFSLFVFRRYFIWSNSRGYAEGICTGESLLYRETWHCWKKSWI